MRIKIIESEVFMHVNRVFVILVGVTVLFLLNSCEISSGLIEIAFVADLQSHLIECG